MTVVYSAAYGALAWAVWLVAKFLLERDLPAWYQGLDKEERTASAFLIGAFWFVTLAGVLAIVLFERFLRPVIRIWRGCAKLAMRGVCYVSVKMQAWEDS